MELVSKSSSATEISGLKKRFSYCSKLVPIEKPVSLVLYPWSVKKSEEVALTEVNNVLSV